MGGGQPPPNTPAVGYGQFRLSRDAPELPKPSPDSPTRFPASAPCNNPACFRSSPGLQPFEYRHTRAPLGAPDNGAVRSSAGPPQAWGNPPLFLLFEEFSLASLQW
ncbi:hypothetical protein AUP68_14413 [Ilyonectria robusta]